MKTIFMLLLLTPIFSSSAQNIGINTNTPNRPLTIAGDAVNQLIGFRSNTNQNAWHINLLTSNNDLNIAESMVADGRFYLKKGGFVGINTTQPTAALTIVGVGGIMVDLKINGRIRVGDPSNNGGVWLTSGNQLFVGMNGSSELGGFYSEGRGWNTLAINTTTGDVGIGTAPTLGNRLTVLGTSLFTDSITVGSPTVNAAIVVNGNILPSGRVSMGPSLLRQEINVSISGNSRAVRIISCPSGYRVIGGGGGHRDFNDAQVDITINYSGPDINNPDSNWRLLLSNKSGDSRALKIYCICLAE